MTKTAQLELLGFFFAILTKYLKKEANKILANEVNLDVRGNFTLKKRVCISPICHKLTREFVIQQESLIQLCGIDYIDHMMSFNTLKKQNIMDKSFLITCSNVLLGLLMFFTILKIMQSTFFSRISCVRIKITTLTDFVIFSLIGSIPAFSHICSFV